MKLKQAAQDALGVQNACNLSGVVHSWSRHLETLWEVAHEEGHGTDWVNRHPINHLFSDKVAQLTQGTTAGYSAAYADCERIANA